MYSKLVWLESNVKIKLGGREGEGADYLGASGATGAAERSQIGNLGQIHGPYACLDATHPVRMRIHCTFKYQLSCSHLDCYYHKYLNPGNLTFNH